jgi:murein DD-endopeptidase MepM/ murein hydrolase activator NlpD
VKKTAFIIAFFLFAALVVAVRCEDMTGQQQKLLNIQSQLAEEKQRLRSTKAEEQKALTNLYVIKKNLNMAKKAVNDATQKVNYNKSKIVSLKREYEDSQAKIISGSAQLRRRIVEIYKSGGGGSVFDLIFSSRSMADFINRSYYFGKVIGRDAVMIENLREQLETMRRAKAELESANVEINNSLYTIQNKKQEIVRSSREQDKIYQSLKSRRLEYEARVRKLEQSSAEIERFIRSRGQTTTVSTGKFIWPLRGRLTSGFGYRRHPIWGGVSLHTGQDIATAYGSPIAAADSGQVIYSGWWDGYGKAVVIDHGRGYTTVYGHMSRIIVQTGQRIEKGQVIGLVGSTGFSTGPHLHFEIRVNGHPVNPLAYLP